MTRRHFYVLTLAILCLFARSAFAGHLDYQEGLPFLASLTADHLCIPRGTVYKAMSNGMYCNDYFIDEYVQCPNRTYDDVHVLSRECPDKESCWQALRTCRGPSECR